MWVMSSVSLIAQRLAMANGAQQNPDRPFIDQREALHGCNP
jgi:hypothetical protein